MRAGRRSAAATLPSVPAVTAWRRFSADPLEFLAELHRRGDDMVELNLGVRRVCFVCSLDLADALLRRSDEFARPPLMRKVLATASGGQSLFTLDGDEWRDRRAVMLPAFSRRAVQAAGEQVVRVVEDETANWPMDTPIPLGPTSRRLTLRVALAYLFDLAGESVEVVDRLAEPFEHENEHVTKQIFSLVRLPEWAPTPGMRRHRRDLELIRASIAELIDITANGLPDLVHRLTVELDRPLSRGDLVTEVLGVLFAGHETTASALTSALVELAKDPAEWDLVARGEVHHGATERAVWCAAETLRMYPPVWGLLRQAQGAVELGGHRFRSGTFFIVSSRDLQRSPDVWTDPDRFDPGRHEHVGRNELAAFMPFGRGPRLCIGSHLANLELAAILTTVTRRFQPVTVTPERSRTVIRMATRLDPEPELTLRARQ